MKVNGKTPMRVLTRKEGRRLFDRQARLLLNLSGKDFARKWERGEFEDPDRPEIMRLAMLLPFHG